MSTTLDLGRDRVSPGSSVQRGRPRGPFGETVAYHPDQAG